MVVEYYVTRGGVRRKTRIDSRADLWKPSNNINPITEKVTEVFSITKGKFFPYLDIQMFWETDDKLEFKVYNKPNQKIKYANNGSCHTKHCLKAIPWGVLSRLAKLASKSKENLETKINELYPEHAEALLKAGLMT